ncbi:MAG: AMP-binding protein [Maritimibacter sp.]|nr:AMP-binding protein [Maritimibacter sp.]
MEHATLDATAIIRTNSIGFVEHVFALNAARRPSVTVHDEAQAKALPGIRIDRCLVPDRRTGWFEDHHPLIHEDLPAQVSYTSGTEGEPKGILLSYANLADAAQRIIDQMQMTSEIREYVGVPATFSFGMGRYRAISAVGGRAYLPPRGFDPIELSRMLSAGDVNALSAVPTLLRILLDAPEIIGDAGQNLRWMEIGSQHMTGEEKRRIREMFPNARILQHYGLTEASRSTFLLVSEAPDTLLDSVGRPAGETEVALGADGRIRIRGPHVATARIDAQGLHALRDSEGWLQTNDLGHMQDGYLFFDGRADDLINFGGIKISPDQLEDRIRRDLAPGIRIAAAKIPNAQRGDGILVAVEGPADIAVIRDLANAALADMGVSAGSALHVEPVTEIPVTGTGKARRAVLAEHFLDRRPRAPEGDTRKTSVVGDVRSLFQREFPGHTVGPDDTFETLGGDSLHYIQFSLAFEQRFGPLPENWEIRSVDELQRGLGQGTSSTWRRLEMPTLLRAFFMICIVALHTDAFVYSTSYGAAYFLVLLAGYSVARFQLPDIIRTGSVKTLVGTIKYVAVPTVLMVALLQVATERFEILPLLLISNYLDPSTLKGFTFYFMEIYIQVLVLAAVLFSLPMVRTAFRDHPMFSALALLLMTFVLRQSIEAIWNGEYNFHRTPWNYGWAFALGIVLSVANDTRSRLLALSVAVVAVLIKWQFVSAAAYVGLGSALLLYVRAITVPAPIKTVVGEIANASMFIYLSHYQMMSVVQKVFGTGKPWLTLVLSILVGIAITHGYAWVSRRFARSPVGRVMVTT